MLPLTRTLVVFSFVAVAPIASATQDPWLPTGPTQSAPASQGVATSAPSLPPPAASPSQPPAPSSSVPQLQLRPPPFPSTPAPASPTNAPVGSWQTNRGPWGEQRQAAAPKPQTRTVWYGWQTLLTDAAAISSAFIRPEIGIGTYALGGPIVHWAHGNTGRGFVSLGVRVVPAGLATLALYSNCRQPANNEKPDEGISCAEGPITMGLIVIATAIVIDAAVLAREEVPVEQTAISLGPVRMMPGFGTTGSQTTFSLSGTF